MSHAYFDFGSRKIYSSEHWCFLFDWRSRRAIYFQRTFPHIKHRWSCEHKLPQCTLDDGMNILPIYPLTHNWADAAHWTYSHTCVCVRKHIAHSREAPARAEDEGKKKNFYQAPDCVCNSPELWYCQRHALKIHVSLRWCHSSCRSFWFWTMARWNCQYGAMELFCDVAIEGKLCFHAGNSPSKNMHTSHEWHWRPSTHNMCHIWVLTISRQSVIIVSLSRAVSAHTFTL